MPVIYERKMRVVQFVQFVTHGPDCLLISNGDFEPSYWFAWYKNCQLAAKFYIPEPDIMVSRRNGKIEAAIVKGTDTKLKIQKMLIFFYLNRLCCLS